MMRALGALVGRELRLGWTAGGGAALPAAFYAGAAAFLPFAIGPDPGLLRQVGPGYLALALALAALVSLERLFQADLEDGTLDQIALGPLPLTLSVMAKIAGQYLAVAGPILTITPVLGLLLQIAPDRLIGLTLILAVAGVALFAIGSIGAALGAGVRRGGLLVALLALPLYAPTVIFAAGAADLYVKGGALASQPFLLLCALALAGAALSPPAAAAGLRLHLE
jgi:heme exporter protein B